MIYLASPYSHPDPRIMHARYLAAEAACVDLLRRREWVYSPIVHCHQMALNHELPTDAGYWRDYNQAMLDKSDQLVVLCLDGWRASVGVIGEMQMWRELGRKRPLPPILYAAPVSGTPMRATPPAIEAVAS